MWDWILENWLTLISAVGVLIAVHLTFFIPKRRRPPPPETSYPTLAGDCSPSIRSPRFPSPEETRPQWYEFLREELDRLPIGLIAFNPPESMRVGVLERIEARITTDLKTELVASLKGRGVPQVWGVKISELMKVRLSGDQFKIVELNSASQVIDSKGYTEWAWDVTPNKSGRQKLYLHVSVRIILPFGEESKDHPVLDRDITVLVNHGHSIKLFLVAYWQWLATALVLPLLVWLFNVL